MEKRQCCFTIADQVNMVWYEGIPESFYRESRLCRIVLDQQDANRPPLMLGVQKDTYPTKRPGSFTKRFNETGFLGGWFKPALPPLAQPSCKPSVQCLRPGMKSSARSEVCVSSWAGRHPTWLPVQK